MSTDVMIYANDLTKRFGAFRALDRINFEVRRGEVVGFLCPNGAGKSTTMRILTCFISPTDGTAKIHGHDVFDEPLEVRRRLGYLPQRAPLYQDMSVWEYLRFVADGPLDDIRSKSGKIRYVVSVSEKDADKGKPPTVTEVESGLRAIAGVRGVSEITTDDKAHSFELAGDQDGDLRADLFRFAVSKGWTLLELRRDAQTLEDVFRDLTKGDERGDRRMGAARDDDDDDSSDRRDSGDRGRVEPKAAAAGE